MRIILFYSATQSFNFFSDQLAKELQIRGHEVFILNLMLFQSKDKQPLEEFLEFVSQKVDAAICFDGLGARDDIFIELWDSWQTVVVDILMDPPLRFHPTFEKHPCNYRLFCCDKDHVEYVKRYFGKEVPFVEFMPHVGVIPEEDIPVIPYKNKKYDILFSGTYYRPQNMFSKLEEMFAKDTPIYDIYLYVFDYLVEDSNLTVEQAMLKAIEGLGLSGSIDEKLLKTLLGCSEPVDWAIRMYQRERVVKVLANAGFDVYLLGRGWENHDCSGYPNVHRIDGRIPYKETLSYMADAKINLNVFPWFKAGTHDRIFNTLLQHSLPLTDSSRWITENFIDGEDIALYDLKQLGQLPAITDWLLQNHESAENMIQKGYEKVRRNFTWSNCVDWILKAIA